VIYFIIIFDFISIALSNLKFNFYSKMGNKISIDKHLSSVDDILDVKPSYFKKKIRFDSNIPENITHHVKVVS